MLTFDGSTDYFQATVKPASSTPISFSAWIYSTDSDANGILSIRGQWNAVGHGIYIDDPNAYVYSRDSGGLAEASKEASANTLYHIAGVVASTTSRICYVDGSPGTEDTDEIDPATAYGTVIGAGSKTGSYNNPSSYFNGEIGEPAIWTAALSADEVLALARGVSPLQIQPQNLWYYNSFLGDTSGRDWTAAGNDLSDQGSVVTSTRQYPLLRRGPVLFSIGTAAGGGGVAPQFVNYLRRRSAG